MHASPASEVPPASALAPCADRIASIDVLRGVALLGILVMNMQAYAMIGAAYLNPTSTGDLHGLDYATWLLSHLFADQKMMTIFSMLFGAGIVLMADRAIARGGRAVGRHYRRMFWLLLIGLAHGYLLWFGDILVTYALTAMILYPLRRLRPRWLIVIAIVLLSIGSLISFGAGLSMPHWPPEEFADLEKDWLPDRERVEHELAVFRGGWTDQMELRAEGAFFMQTFLFGFMMFWRAGGCMLLGMALFKLGVFAATRSARYYRTWVALGVAIGLPMIGYGVHQHHAHAWAIEYSFFQGTQYNYWGSLLVALGWTGAVMLLCRANALPALTTRLAAVGRMALTNYLMQTVICTTLFYGHGFGLFGSLSRFEQAGVIAAIWVATLLWSPWWLARYRFGPAEWLWRSLTYWRKQPMRRTQ